MHTKRSLLPLLALGLAVASPARALDWSDNAFKLAWGPAYREPGVGQASSPNQGQDIAKTTITFTHVSGDKWGGHFLNVDLLRSDKYDPSAGSPQGATEVYAVYRRNLSLNKLTGSKSFSFGFVRDTLLEAGLDISTKNTGFAPHKVMPIAGVALSLDVPGFWTVGAYLQKEWNNNGITGKSVDFDVAATFATAWGVGLWSLPLTFEGFGSVNLPKGTDGFGNKTATEILVQPKLTWAVGSLWGDAKAGYTLGVGYQYWVNKFGNDDGLTIGGAKVNVGSKASTVFLEAGIHL